MLRRLLPALVLLVSPLAHAQTGSQGLTLIGQLNPRASQGYADIWGYVAPDGREYALMNTRSGGMTVIDVTTMPPVEVAYIPGSGIGSDIEVYQNYVYVSNDQANTRIFSLADPTNPVEVGMVPTDAHTITIAGDYLYTQGGPPPGGVRIYHLANPASPTFVGQYQPHYVHDIHVRGDTMYTAGIYGDGIDIVDLSNRASPQLISRFNYPGSGAHNVCTTEDGAYAYVGDEIGVGRWTRIFDVRDPQNVTLVGEIKIVQAPSTVVHNCHVKGNLLYIGYYSGYGARVYDISNPVAPVEVAYYETGSGMMWSVYPHLPSGKIIGSLYLSGGLRVFRLDGVVANEPGTGGAVLALSAAPNPIRGAGTVRFALPEAGEVRLALYDVLGREVAVVAEGERAAGDHTATVDVSALAPGVYVLRLTAGADAATATLTIAR